MGSAGVSLCDIEEMAAQQYVQASPRDGCSPEPCEIGSPRDSRGAERGGSARRARQRSALAVLATRLEGTGALGMSRRVSDMQLGAWAVEWDTLVCARAATAAAAAPSATQLAESSPTSGV